MPRIDSVYSLEKLRNIKNPRDLLSGDKDKDIESIETIIGIDQETDIGYDYTFKIQENYSVPPQNNLLQEYLSRQQIQEKRYKNLS